MLTAGLCFAPQVAASQAPAPLLPPPSADEAMLRQQLEAAHMQIQALAAELAAAHGGKPPHQQQQQPPVAQGVPDSHTSLHYAHHMQEAQSYTQQQHSGDHFHSYDESGGWAAASEASQHAASVAAQQDAYIAQQQVRGLRAI